ncbi:MAG: NUDIX domain-containing protein [Methanocorpusculum sp.]|nr:NUDIX domain-containing protein [Methanocorpusculum sp.]
MRAPFQILAIPYKIKNNTPLFCVLHRFDDEIWQFAAGGGEDNETPLDSAVREIFEETGVKAENIIQLTSKVYVPADCIAECHRKMWAAETYVIPEYSFAFECNEVHLSFEHTEYLWLPYDEANKILSWDSNKTALYELMCRLNSKN